MRVYNTSYSSASNTLSAYSGANWDLTKPFVPLQAGAPSSVASGLSMFAGMVKWEDYQSGSINHALNWAAIGHTVSNWNYVLPASSTDGLSFAGSSSYQLPYGAHIRLKASFSTAGWGPQATMVANALKTYGAFLTDTGSSGNALYFGNASDGSNPWNSSDLGSLHKLTLSDFDVVNLGRFEPSPVTSEAVLGKIPEKSSGCEPEDLLLWDRQYVAADRLDGGLRSSRAAGFESGDPGIRANAQHSLREITTIAR